MSEWISVDDINDAPLYQDYQTAYSTRDVICTDGENVFIATYAIGGNHVGIPWCGFQGVNADYITHWMPLPEPPKCKQ